MYTSSLNSITAEYIKSITNNGVFTRGLSYFRSGRVLNLKYRDGELTAAVSGSESFPYEVSILADEEEIYSMDCTCLYASDGEICKHIVATLLQWIENRNKKSAYKPLLPRKPKFFNPLPFIIPKFKDIDEPDSFPFFDNSPTHILSEIFSAFGDFNLKVDLLNGGPQLELKLVSDQGDESVFHISATKSPRIFEKLKEMDDAQVELSERARQTKLYKTPFVPHLHADINDQGHLELSPVLKLNSASKKEQFLPVEKLRDCKINDEWIWLNNSYRPVAPIPPQFKPYFNNEKPLVYKEKDAIDFLREDFNQLLAEPSFRPSERLKLVEVHDNPDVSYMQVEVCDSDWLWLDPVYKVGKHTITLQEILASIDKNHCIRKDMDYIEIPKDILDIWQRGSGIIENGRLKMPKLGYLRTRAECGKHVKVNACDETRKFLMNFDRITPPQPAPPVDSYKGELRTYQQSGCDWLWFLHTNKFGGILADEMGLGKTHQAMVVILSALQTEPNLPNLVICPTSVLDHWESKLQTYAP
ncbi:MAG: SNF2-related protein, partial [Planctomycetota bacterium]